MRALWITLALTLAPGLTKADVVYSVTSLPVTETIVLNGSSSGFTNTVGQSFQNTLNTANVESVTFRLRYFSTAYTAGTLQVGIYATSTPGSALNYTPTGAALATSGVIDASSLTSGLNNYTFSNFSTASLNTSDVYMAVLQTADLATGNGIVVGGYNGIPSGTYQNYNLALDGARITNQQLYGTITVPEPGTLLLGSIAAACGGGAWWRRKRHKASKATAKESVA